MTVDYKAVLAGSPDALETEVRKWLAKGWVPQGGMMICAEGAAPLNPYKVYGQAMVKVQENK